MSVLSSEVILKGCMPTMVKATTPIYSKGEWNALRSLYQIRKGSKYTVLPDRDA